MCDVPGNEGSYTCVVTKSKSLCLWSLEPTPKKCVVPRSDPYICVVPGSEFLHVYSLEVNLFIYARSLEHESKKNGSSALKDSTC